MHQPFAIANGVVVQVFDVDVVDGGRGVFGVDRLDGRLTTASRDQYIPDSQIPGVHPRSVSLTISGSSVEFVFQAILLTFHYRFQCFQCAREF